MKKRAVFFSTDALIALAIILLVVLIAYPFITKTQVSSDMHYDVIKTLSSLKVNEVNNSYVQGLISQGTINNTNISLLEQIGEFSVTDFDLAKALADSVLSDLDFGNNNIGLWYDNKLVYSRNSTAFESAEKVETARQFISGLRQGENITGFAARASLSNTFRQEYFYFGGYVGDGDLSLRLEYEGIINSSEMEIVINNDFNLYINGIYSGNYSKSPSEFSPNKYNIPITHFNSGENTIELKGNNLHIAGGFIKIIYESDVQYEQPEKYYFPGIEGVINLYDGFYIPGQLNSLKISLHLDNNYSSMFLNIGNVTVFNETTNGEETVTITNTYLSSLLDYDALSSKTIPLRLGFEEAAYVGVSREADVFSVTDISASMNQQCPTCGGGVKLIDLAVDANKVFIDIVLNNSGNRVGLAGYKKAVYPEDFHSLSDDSVSLKQKVDSWNPSQGNCICCGINKAAEALDETSEESKLRVMVVMGDGKPTQTCPEQNTGSADNDAIQAAKDACDNYGIIVDAVGFGLGVDEFVMMEIAAKGCNGTYYYSELSDLADVYQDIAENILTTYAGQTVTAFGGYTRLYPDSYIEFGYNTSAAPYGLVITAEIEFTDAYFGDFSIPPGATVLETAVASYSGPRWTDTVTINGNNVYTISDYGSNYISLGDPYFINIPTHLVNEGLNSVNLTTGISPTNTSEGSASNKIIYTMLSNASSFSGIYAVALGCNWHIQFEDNSEIDIPIPSSYSGAENCVFNETFPGEISSTNDAYQVATLELLKDLDLDNDGKIDIYFSGQDLQVSLSEVTGIPFILSMEVETRIWS